MKNKIQIKVSREMLKHSQINDYYLYRELAVKMVKEMPMQELRKLIEFTKTDPNSEHSKRVLWGEDYPAWRKTLIHQLRNESAILYEAECYLM